MTTDYLEFESVLGKILLAARDNAICGLWFSGQKYEASPDDSWQHQPDDPLLLKAQHQLQEYFAGKRSNFDLPVKLKGTDFQQQVWKELEGIGCGETITYKELARRLGKPSAVRAAAAAVGRNPASVIVPCHRVLGSNGSLTGYAGGLGRKEKLLELET